MIVRVTSWHRVRPRHLLPGLAGGMVLCMLAVAAARVRPVSQATEEDLLVARAHSFLEAHAKIESNETVLMLSDRTIDELVRKAFFEAASKSGVTVTELLLQGHPEITDGLEIARKMRFHVWYPEWIWQTVENADVVLELTNLGSGHMGERRKPPTRARIVDIPFARREQLADPMSRGHYPEEIVEAIAKVVWRHVWGGQRIELTDPQGTDLRWTLDATAWDEVRSVDPAKSGDHLSLPPPYRARTPDMTGWLVASSTHSGPLPRVRLKIENGRVVDVQDGRHVRDYLLKMFAASAAVSFPGFPGPGSNWVEETTIGTRPRHARVPGAERLGWSAEMSAWSGAPRAGVFHLAIGTSRSGRNAAFARQRELEVQHLDLELYAPTLVIDGQTIISRGHLLGLDDPEVRRVAAQYGNPDELLRVTWFPSTE